MRVLQRVEDRVSLLIGCKGVREYRRFPLLAMLRRASASRLTHFEAEIDFSRQVGRIHPREGSDVFLLGHARFSLDRRQIGLQEAGATERNAVRAALGSV